MSANQQQSNPPTGATEHSLAPSAGSFSALASELLADAEAWAKEYRDRHDHFYKRGAYREATHFEDLYCAADRRASDIRRLMERANLRQPKTNGKLCREQGGKDSDGR